MELIEHLRPKHIPNCYIPLVIDKICVVYIEGRYLDDMD